MISPFAARSLARLTSSTCDSSTSRSRAGRALEGDTELVLVDVTHQRLRRGGIQLDEIVEGEHQRLDALGGFAVVLFECGHEPGLGLTVEIVEDFRHDLVGIAAAGLRK